MNIGIIRTSLKENERRLPIYPEHLPWISKEIREKLIFEIDYGVDYGYSNEYFFDHMVQMARREEILSSCDMLVLPKAIPVDLRQMKKNAVLFGWAHCVQQHEMAQTAIDRELTLIAWESMHLWNAFGEKQMHIFYKNNEIAGYAAALHMMQLLGIDGHYGPRRKVIIIGYGSVSRGAIYALQGRGFNDLHVYTRRPTHLVSDQNPDVYYHHLDIKPNQPICVQNNDGSTRLFIDELSEAGIICNGVLQDTNQPLLFVDNTTLNRLKPRSVIIDISCDKGMGFSFARPTTFSDPTFLVGDGIAYYSVDHAPSYLWNAASREISKALMPFLPIIANDPSKWKENETIRRAIEIENGRILNQNILSFQKRKKEFPHSYIQSLPME
jgi:alanine dehydrogenase